MLEIIEKIYEIIQQSLFLLIATIIVVYINDLRLKIKNEKKFNSLKTLNDIIKNTVIAINQEVVSKTKEKNENNKLTETDICYIKKLCKQRINYLSSDKLKKEIESIIHNYDFYINDMIERIVSEQKYKRYE